MISEEQMIEQCMENQAQLDPWARGYVANLNEILHSGGEITLDQHERLVAIWEELDA